MGQRRSHDEVKRHQHRADRRRRAQEAETEGADLQHVGEDRQQGDRAAEQDGE